MISAPQSRRRTDIRIPSAPGPNWRPTGWTIRAGDDVRSAYGGSIGAKVVIREGTFDDYDKFHLIRKYHYIKPLVASHLLAFGSPRRGPAYAEGDVAYLSTRGYGWAQDFSRDNRQRKPIVGFREGAYYSALSGTCADTYRIGNLADGHYLLSFMAGNFAGMSNRFCKTGSRPSSGCGGIITRRLALYTGTANWI